MKILSKQTLYATTATMILAFSGGTAFAQFAPGGGGGNPGGGGGVNPNEIVCYGNNQIAQTGCGLHGQVICSRISVTACEYGLLCAPGSIVSRTCASIACGVGHIYEFPNSSTGNIGYGYGLGTSDSAVIPPACVAQLGNGGGSGGNPGGPSAPGGPGTPGGGGLMP